VVTKYAATRLIAHHPSAGERESGTDMPRVSASWRFRILVVSGVAVTQGLAIIAFETGF
jgi:hypothetical protein